MSFVEISHCAEGATERLSLLSLRKGIELYLEPEKPEKAAQKHITLKPYTAEEKKQILEKWRQDCEGQSIIRSATIKFD